MLVNPGTPEERELKPSSDQNRLRHGDLVRILSAGGGGWGNTLERPMEQVRDDVLDGFVSQACAREDYGVVLDPSGLAVDEMETRTLRKSLRGETKMFHRGSYSEGDEARR